MSERLTKHRPTVDLDRFERDMHDDVSYRHDDPLAELARLVGEQHDPYGDVFAHEAVASAHGAHPAYAQHGELRREPGFGAGPAMSPRLTGDFAAIEAGLRGAADSSQGHAEPAFDSAYDHHAEYADPAYEQDWAAAPQAAPQRSRQTLRLVAATIAVGVIGIGTAFALKGHVGTSPSDVKTILADSSPTKVQPPADVTDKDAGQDAAVLGKGQPSPTALASHEEQPVDVAQAVQDNAAPRTDASNVPVPLSPGQVQTAMADPAAPASQAFPLSEMPAPKRVRVVAVRPDGTIRSDDAPAAAAPTPNPAPRLPTNKTSDKAGPVAKPATPKAAAKSTSRVAAPKSVEQLAGDDGAAPQPAPAATKPMPKKPKLQRVASADTGEQEATAAIAPTAADAGGGGFAVQLAAPGSEAEAKVASSRLAKKFAGPLGGRHLAFHKADSNGKSVYRIRVGSLSKGDAVSLCEKLKADGGSCFVAKN